MEAEVLARNRTDDLLAHSRNTKHLLLALLKHRRPFRE
jgi:hypothetical protein